MNEETKELLTTFTKKLFMQLIKTSEEAVQKVLTDNMHKEAYKHIALDLIELAIVNAGRGELKIGNNEIKEIIEWT